MGQIEQPSQRVDVPYRQRLQARLADLADRVQQAARGRRSPAQQGHRFHQDGGLAGLARQSDAQLDRLPQLRGLPSALALEHAHPAVPGGGGVHPGRGPVKERLGQGHGGLHVGLGGAGAQADRGGHRHRHGGGAAQSPPARNVRLQGHVEAAGIGRQAREDAPQRLPHRRAVADHQIQVPGGSLYPAATRADRGAHPQR
jgi:hypothetical protein